MLSPIPFDCTSQKLMTIQIISRRDVSFHLVPVTQSTITNCFANDPRRSGPKPHKESDLHTVDYLCRQIYFGLCSVANAPIGVIFGSRWQRTSRAQHETTENVRILFCAPSKFMTVFLFIFFSYLVNLIWGFRLEQACDLNMAELSPQCQCIKS